jgi:aldose 1-epimerase
MLGASLLHRGEQLLRKIENLEEAAARGTTVGIPLLYPYANRLAVAGYRVLGKDVVLDPASPLLNCDERGLLIHGVRWAAFGFDVSVAQADRLVAHLDWTCADLLAVYPFRHRLEMAVSLHPDRLIVETTVEPEEALPVSFGFHPYLGLPRTPRAQWHLRLPAMRRLKLDERRIPTGTEAPFAAFAARLADWSCDAGFIVPKHHATFELSGAGRRIAVEFQRHYPYAQIFAPRAREFVSVEPMTAPANALVSGRGLAIARPGEPYRAAFCIRVDDDAGFEDGSQPLAT